MSETLLDRLDDIVRIAPNLNEIEEINARLEPDPRLYQGWFSLLPGTLTSRLSSDGANWIGGDIKIASGHYRGRDGKLAVKLDAKNPLFLRFMKVIMGIDQEPYIYRFKDLEEALSNKVIDGSFFTRISNIYPHDLTIYVGHIRRLITE
jgi:hypothetical protein